MGDLEGWFLDNFGPLTDETWPANAGLLIRDLVREGTQLAKWALKTAATMERVGPVKDVVDPETSQNLRGGQLPGDFYVDIGYVREATIGGRIGRGFMLKTNDGKDVWHEHTGRQSFDMAIQLWHLAIRAFRCPHLRPTYRPIDGMFPLRLYPRPFDPTATDSIFRNLNSFLHRMVLEPDGEGSNG
jgi:hypothetical protein